MFLKSSQLRIDQLLIDQSKPDNIFNLIDEIEKQYRIDIHEEISPHQKTLIFWEYIKQLPQGQLKLFRVNVINTNWVVEKICLPQFNFINL